MSEGLPVRLLGNLSQAAVQDQISKARLVILPSKCYETFSLVLRDSIAHGTPIAVSNLGPLPEIVSHLGPNLVFDPFNVSSVYETIKNLWSDDETLRQISNKFRTEYFGRYTPDKNYLALSNIYSSVVGNIG